MTVSADPDLGYLLIYSLLQNTVNLMNVTELYTEEMVKMANFMFYIYIIMI